MAQIAAENGAVPPREQQQPHEQQQQQNQQPPPPAAAAAPPAPPQPPGGGGGALRPLIGRAGTLHIVESLKNYGPDATIASMQSLHGLAHPLCRPLLELTDHLSISRRDAHMHVLTRARALLLRFVRALAAKQAAAARAAAAAAASGDARAAAAAARDEEDAQGRLEALLGASFPYLGIPELRPVPLEVLGAMEAVPAPFLKLLAEDRDMFAGLPPRVKQQVYEHDRALLQSVAIETIATYKYEAATLLCCLDMRQFVGVRPVWEDDEGSGVGGGVGGGAGGRGSGSGGGGVGGAAVGPGGAPLPPRPLSRGGPAGLGGGGPGGGSGPRGAGGGGGGFQLSSLLSRIGGDPKQQQQQQQRQQQQGALRRPGSSGSPNRGAGSPGGGASAGWDRRRLRAGSDAVKRLRAMVGGSARIYGHLLELCEIRLHASDAPYLSLKELSYCALRTQLAMALHDAGADALLRGADACYELAWALDAAIGARRVGAGHLRRLREMFARYQPAAPRHLHPLAGAVAAAPRRLQQQQGQKQARGRAASGDGSDDGDEGADADLPAAKRPRAGGGAKYAGLPGSLLASAPAVARTGLPQRAARRNWRPVALAESDEEDDEEWGGGGALSAAGDSSSGGELSGDISSDDDEGGGAKKRRAPPPPPPPAAAAAAAPRPPRVRIAPAAPPPAEVAEPAGRGVGDDDSDDDEYSMSDGSDDDDDALDEGPARKRGQGRGCGRGRGRGRGGDDAARAPAPVVAAAPVATAAPGSGAAAAPRARLTLKGGRGPSDSGGGAVAPAVAPAPPLPPAATPSPRAPTDMRPGSSGGAAAASAPNAPPGAANAPAGGIQPVAGSFVAKDGATAASAAAAVAAAKAAAAAAGGGLGARDGGGGGGAGAAGGAAAAAAAAAAAEAEDAAGRGGAHADRWLAQAGMALRDPPAQHLLAAAAVGRLHRCVAERTLPRADLALGLLLQLLELGADARRQLRERRYRMPPPPRAALAGAWAHAAGILAEAALDPRPRDDAARDCGYQESDPGGAAALIAEYRAGEAARRVFQALALDRLAARDLVTARLLLALMRDSGHWAFASAVPEYAPFAYSLAGELQDLVRAGALHAGSPLWQLAFEGVLLDLLDAHPMVHSEALRLVLLVAKSLPAEVLAGHLGRMLEKTRESRASARHRKAKYHEREARARREAEEFEALAGDYLSGFGGGGGGGGPASEWSDGFTAVRSLKYGGDDTFSDLYRKAVAVGGLRDTALPEAVRAFLRETARPEGGRAGGGGGGGSGGGGG